MKENLRIPKKLKAGFQERTDTYSGKLAFVVWIDDKGVLKQQKSWEGWRSKDIPAEDYDNEPMSGFVLNRDVGGSQRSYGWNARREKVRVYDPRNFEIEITVDNLLFILQECSSIKGKGLEGEFVYAWAGNSIVLLPTCSDEYKSSVQYTSLQGKRVYKADMEEGCTYMTKDNVAVMYMGRHEWWEYGHYEQSLGTKYHIFLNLDYKPTNYDEDDGYGKPGKYFTEKGFTKLATKTSDSPVDSYADAYEELMSSAYTSPPKSIIFEPKDKSDEKSKNSYYAYCKSGGKYYYGYHYGGYNYYSKNNQDTFNPYHELKVKDGLFIQEQIDNRCRGSECIKDFELGRVYIESQNGGKVYLG